MPRVIHLPGPGVTVSLGNYVRGIKTAKANPNELFKYGLTTWWETSGSEIMKQFRHGMHDRINQGIPYHQRGVL